MSNEPKNVINQLLLTTAITGFLMSAGLAHGGSKGGAHNDGHDHSMMKGHHEEMMKSRDNMGHSLGSLAGVPGEEGNVSRAIDVAADDSMRFTHAPFNIKKGETIKFIVTNKGVIPHEFAIGTKDEHTEHGQMMMNNPNMHHGVGGNAITIKPGETEVLTWTFENAPKVEVACNIPGHYEAGMHSPVTINDE